MAATSTLPMLVWMLTMVVPLAMAMEHGLKATGVMWTFKRRGAKAALVGGLVQQWILHV